MPSREQDQHRSSLSILRRTLHQTGQSAEPLHQAQQPAAPVQAVTHQPAALSPHGLAQLQRAIGNQAVAHLVADAQQHSIAPAAFVNDSRRLTLQRMFSISNFKRPNFNSSVYTTATMSHNLFQASDIDPYNPELSSRNAAVPHRMSWADIRDNTLKYLNGTDDETAFIRWTDRFTEAAEEDKKIFQNHKNQVGSQINTASGSDLTRLTSEYEWCDAVIDHIEASIKHVAALRYKVTTNYKAYKTGTVQKAAVIEAAGAFLKAFNSYYPNVPDLGPHRGTNIQVSNRAHLNVDSSGGLSPMSNQVLNMTPGRTSGVATTPNRTQIVSTQGEFVPLTNLSATDQTRVANQGTVGVNAKPPDWSPQ